MLGLLVVGICIAGSSPGHGQELDPGATSAVPVLNGSGPEVVPIVTRAWAHDDFGRMVFDWPWAVAYGARIEGKTLTVMFDRRLHTTFQQIPRHLGTYITNVDLGPDGQSVVASLTNEYRLRTFLLNNEEGGVKVVVDLLADGEAGLMLAQAPTPPSPAPSPEAVPGDPHPSPHISGDAPLPLAEAAPETLPAELPPSLPFAAEADAPPERGEEEAPPPVKADADVPPAEPDSTPESVPTAEATPPVETTATPEPGTEPAPETAPPAETEATPETASESSPPGRPVLSPVEGGAAQRLSRAESKERGGSTDVPPSLDSTGEQVAEQSADQTAVPPVGAATEPPEGNPPQPFDKLRATPPERGAEEAPPAEPTPETVSEETPQTETATSPHPDPLPEGEGEGASSTPDASSEETAAVIEDTPSTETATPAATETPPVTTEPTPQPPTPNPQFPTLPASVQYSPLSEPTFPT